MKEREKARRKLDKIVKGSLLNLTQIEEDPHITRIESPWRDRLIRNTTDRILSIPSLAILSDDQALPLRDVHTTCEHCNDHELGIEDMLNSNFKRVI